MLGDLFDEGPSEAVTASRGTSLPLDLEPRGDSGFVGLQNQGMTCYLNSLLQTMFMTPELRAGIYNLSSEDLGVGQARERPLNHEASDVTLNKGLVSLRDGSLEAPAEIASSMGLSYVTQEEQTMVDMGFPLAAVQLALKNHPGDQFAAITALLEGQYSVESAASGLLEAAGGGADDVARPETLGAKSTPPNPAGAAVVGGNQGGKGRKKRVRRGLAELQRLFAWLQAVDQKSISTEPLTQSFGWDSGDAREQHDVHELNRLLFDALEESLKGTSEEKLIDSLYHGKLVSAVICQVCGAISGREETFSDFPVVVKGFSSLEESLGASVKAERLEGDNQYFCEKCGRKVDAERWQRPDFLPQILTLPLCRFEYDWERDERKKICTPFSFPPTLDFTPYMAEGGCAPSAKRNAELAETNAKSAVMSSDGCDGVSAFDTSAGDNAESARRSETSPGGDAESAGHLDTSAGQDAESARTSAGKGADSADSTLLETARSAGELATSAEPNSLLYDLLSVVIHSGNAHSGHYHVYIRDFTSHPQGPPLSTPPSTPPSDNTSPRNCTFPSDKKPPCNNISHNEPHTSKKSTFQDPLEGQGLTSTSPLSTSEVKSIGYGESIETDTTTLDFRNKTPNEGGVSSEPMHLGLEASEAMPLGLEAREERTVRGGCAFAANGRGEEDEKSKEGKVMENEMEVWFDFNDSHVTRVSWSDITKRFGGSNECAYMLTYRARRTARSSSRNQGPPAEIANSLEVAVPERLKEALVKTNEDLRKEREESAKQAETLEANRQLVEVGRGSLRSEAYCSVYLPGDYQVDGAYVYELENDELQERCHLSSSAIPHYLQETLPPNLAFCLTLYALSPPTNFPQKSAINCEENQILRSNPESATNIALNGTDNPESTTNSPQNMEDVAQNNSQIKSETVHDNGQNIRNKPHRRRRFVRILDQVKLEDWNLRSNEAVLVWDDRKGPPPEIPTTEIEGGDKVFVVDNLGGDLGGSRILRVGVKEGTTVGELKSEALRMKKQEEERFELEQVVLRRMTAGGPGAALTDQSLTLKAAGIEINSKLALEKRDDRPPLQLLLNFVNKAGKKLPPDEHPITVPLDSTLEEIRRQAEIEIEKLGLWKPSRPFTLRQSDLFGGKAEVVENFSKGVGAAGVTSGPILWVEEGPPPPKDQITLLIHLYTLPQEGPPQVTLARTLATALGAESVVATTRLGCADSANHSGLPSPADSAPPLQSTPPTFAAPPPNSPPSTFSAPLAESAITPTAHALAKSLAAALQAKASPVKRKNSKQSGGEKKRVDLGGVVAGLGGLGVGTRQRGSLGADSRPVGLECQPLGGLPSLEPSSIGLESMPTSIAANPSGLECNLASPVSNHLSLELTPRGLGSDSQSLGSFSLGLGSNLGLQVSSPLDSQHSPPEGDVLEAGLGPKNFAYVGELKMSKNGMVKELKERLLRMPAFGGWQVQLEAGLEATVLSGLLLGRPLSSLPTPLKNTLVPEFLRVRDLSSGKPSREFRNHSKKLHQLYVGSGRRLAVRIIPPKERRFFKGGHWEPLSEEDKPSTHSLLLLVQKAIPTNSLENQARYGPPLVPPLPKFNHPPGGGFPIPPIPIMTSPDAPKAFQFSTTPSWLTSTNTPLGPPRPLPIHLGPTLPGVGPMTYASPMNTPNSVLPSPHYLPSPMSYCPPMSTPTSVPPSPMSVWPDSLIRTSQLPNIEPNTISNDLMSSPSLPLGYLMDTPTTPMVDPRALHSLLPGNPDVLMKDMAPPKPPLSTPTSVPPSPNATALAALALVVSQVSKVNLQRFIFEHPEEVLFDPGEAVLAPAQLFSFLSSVTGLPSHRLLVAKRSTSNEWKPLPPFADVSTDSPADVSSPVFADISNTEPADVSTDKPADICTPDSMDVDLGCSTKPQEERTRVSKPKTDVVNLRHAPFQLKDGESIVVLDRFASPHIKTHEQFAAALNSGGCHSQKKGITLGGVERTGSNERTKQTRRPEAALRIRMDDFE